MPEPSGTDHLPHAECVEAVRARLLVLADQHLAEYQRLDRHRSTRGNGRVQRRKATAYGWTAGQLTKLLEGRP